MAVTNTDDHLRNHAFILSGNGWSLSPLYAESCAKDVLEIVREHWESLASGYGLTRRQIEEMRPAFRACCE